jgi:CRISPR-associated protein Csm3
MFAKIKITASLQLETGLHIGGSDAFAAIGAIDSPVMKDPVTNLPIIPGSSIKGKMRSLLAKAYNNGVAIKVENDSDEISRLFGNAKSDKFKNGKLIFRDAFLSNKEELEKKGANMMTEIKFENTIDRITAEANPRQIERAIVGSCFAFELIYEISGDNVDINKDIEIITNGLKLLELDYLGGSGSRGYGKVKFNNVAATTVYGDYDSKAFNEKLQAASL